MTAPPKSLESVAADLADLQRTLPAGIVATLLLTTAEGTYIMTPFVNPARVLVDALSTVVDYCNAPETPMPAPGVPS